MRLNLVLACLAIWTSLPAQLAGAYTVDPQGSGARNFPHLNDATRALDQQGISGAVEFTIADGTYTGPWYITPVRGASATSRVTFKAATRHAVNLGHDPTQRRSIEFAFASVSTPVEFFVFDGLSLSGAIYNGSSGFTANLEIRHCLFPPGNRLAIELRGDGHDFHHNRIRAERSVLVTGGGTEFHHNTVEGGDILLNGALVGEQRIYNNLFNGRRTTALRITNGFNGTIAHNTIVADARQDSVVEIGGHLIRPARFFGNIVVNLHTSNLTGPVLSDTSLTGSGITSDGNLFFKVTNQGALFREGSTTYATLPDWQNATGQDRSSMVSDPKFVQVGVDHQLAVDSPAIDKAVGTPAYVTDDRNDEPRDSLPDIGCYERFQPFRTFGDGCPGSFGFIPAVGTSGTAALGSTNFAFTLNNGLGSATAFLAYGGSNTSWNGVPLPFSLGGGCDILVSLDLVAVITTAGSGPGNGTGSLRLNIPNDPRIRGKSLFVQWGVIDSAAVPGLAFSNGGHLMLR